MNLRLRLALFAALLLLALAALFPLRLALGDASALTARGARGTIWNGRMSDARLGPVPLGDLRVRANPFWVLTGRTRLHLAQDARPPAWRAGLTRLDQGADVIAEGYLPLQGALGSIPVTGLVLDAARLRFAGERCLSAAGRVSALLSGEMAGVAFPDRVTGPAQCDGDGLLLPMADVTGQTGLTLRVAPSGAWRADIRLSAPTPEIAASLTARGFQRSGAAYRLSVMGR